MCFLLLLRDQSASATYYFREKTESEKASDTKTPASAQDNLVREWMYYRSLQHGESEFALRNKQVRSIYVLYLCTMFLNIFEATVIL